MTMKDNTKVEVRICPNCKIVFILAYGYCPICNAKLERLGEIEFSRLYDEDEFDEE